MGDDSFNEPLAKLYLGRYEVADYNVDWYYRSGIGSLSDPVVVAWRKGQAADDTLAESTSIYDVEVENDSLVVFSCEPIQVEDRPGLPIRVVVTDTLGCHLEWNRTQ